MESMILNVFLNNWPRKLVAILTAIVIWLFVNHSIQETKIITNVPVRIINLPSDKTIQGLLPNGVLSRRITLTLTGSKDVIEDLEAGDLEVLLDASTADSDEWIVQITKKNLVSLNPSIDLLQHITQVDHTDFVIKLSKLVTAKIPVIIEFPKGSAPQGYEFLDIWPQSLMQTVSGPEEEIQQLKEEGLELTFDLNEISKSDLDAVKTASTGHNDEISFPIPKKWKQVPIHFRNSFEELNDPEASNLRIDFLRKEMIAFDKEIPIRLFYPLDDLEVLNPKTLSLELNNDIQKQNDVSIFKRPLFAKEVSRLFLDIVRNSIEIVIVTAPKSKREFLAWSFQFINPHDLEETYVAFSLANSTNNKSNSAPKKKEEMLRKRFRDYMQRLTLYLTESKKLHLKNTVEGNQVRVVAY